MGKNCHRHLPHLLPFSLSLHLSLLFSPSNDTNMGFDVQHCSGGCHYHSHTIYSIHSDIMQRCKSVSLSTVELNNLCLIKDFKGFEGFYQPWQEIKTKLL